MIASVPFLLSRKPHREFLGNVLGNSLPESAQGFLTFALVEYYDAPAFLPDVLFNFASNVLKTS
jgi:hypothetical protein